MLRFARSFAWRTGKSSSSRAIPASAIPAPPRAWTPSSPLSQRERGEEGVRGSLSFTEYNAEPPAAVAYNDVLSEVFYTLPVMRAFERRYEVRPLPGQHHMLHALLDAYEQWGGRGAPRTALP